MRILISTETFLPKVDGIVKVACLTLEYFQEWGIDALILAPQKASRTYAGATVYTPPAVKNVLYPEGRVAIAHWNTYRLIRSFQPDLYHAFGPMALGAGALLMAKSLHIPTVASFHLSLGNSARTYGFGKIAPMLEGMRRWIFNQADHALAPSLIAQNMMRENGVKRVGHWRRGVNTDDFHPRYRDEAMRELLSDGHPEETILLYVGRLAADKRIHHMRAVLEHVSGTRLALVGGGPYESELRQIFAGLPVTFVGYKLGEDLARAYASADMFVFASQHETFGLVLTEALASGLPVVSVRVGGAEDVVIPGETGYIFEHGDIAALIDSVRHLHEQPTLRREMSEKARRYAEQMTWPDMMLELRHFYEDMLAERGRIPKPDRSTSPMYVAR